MFLLWRAFYLTKDLQLPPGQSLQIQYRREILINTKSLGYKVDELQTKVRFLHDFRDVCLLAITNSWLMDCDLNAELALDGFSEPEEEKEEKKNHRREGCVSMRAGTGAKMFLSEKTSALKMLNYLLCLYTPALRPGIPTNICHRCICLPQS